MRLLGRRIFFLKMLGRSSSESVIFLRTLHFYSLLMDQSARKLRKSRLFTCPSGDLGDESRRDSYFE